MCIIVLFTAFVMKTFEVCVLKSFDDFGSFAADGLTVKLACRHTKSARGRNNYFVGVFKLFEIVPNHLARPPSVRWRLKRMPPPGICCTSPSRTEKPFFESASRSVWMSSVFCARPSSSVRSMP